MDSGPTPREHKTKKVDLEAGKQHSEEVSFLSAKSTARTLELLRALNAAAAAIQKSVSLEDQIFKAFTDQVSALGLRGGLVLLDETGESVTVRAIAQPSGFTKRLSQFEKIFKIKAMGYSVPITKVGAYQTVIQTRNCIYLPDSSETIAQLLPPFARPFSQRIIDAFGKSAVVYAPMIVDGRVIGVLNIAGVDITEEDTSAIQAFANHIAIALTNHRLFLQAQKEIDERKHAEKNLEDREKYFRVLIENSAEAIAVISARGQIVYESPSALNLVGLSMEELKGKDVFGFVHPDDYAISFKLFMELARKPGKPVTGQIRYRHVDGTWHWVEATGANLLNDPTVKGIVVNYRDITERKQAEIAARNAELRLQKLIENGLDYISLLDTSGKLVWENPSSTSLLGYGFNERVGQNLFELIHPDDLERINPRFAELIKKPGGRSEDVFRLRREDGQYRWIEAIATNLLNEPAVGAIVVNYRDITQRKQAEESLKRSEQVLRLFVEHAPAAVAMLDRDMRYIAASQRYLQDYRLAQQDLTGRSHYEIFPEIPERWKEIHRRCLAGAVEKSDEDSFLRTDGTLDWVRWEIHPWYESSGEVGGLMLFSEVITERKQAEEQVRLLSRFPSENPSPVMRFTMEGRIEYANAASQPLLDDWNLQVGDEIPQGLGMSLSNALEGGQPLEFELTTVSGVSYSCILAPVPEEGYVNFYGRDTTERRQMETRLRESEERYRLATNASNDVIWEWNIQTNGLSWTKNVQIVFGYSPEEVGSDSAWWEERIHPEDRERVISKLEKLLAGRASAWWDEYRFRLRHGSYAYVSDRAYIERDVNGRAVRMVGAMTDVSERKKSEEEIQRRVLELEALYQSGIGFSQTLDPRDIAEKVIEVMMFQLDWHHAAVRVRRGDTDELELLAFSGSDEQEGDESRVRSVVGRVGEGMTGWVIEHGEILRSSNLPDDPRYVETFPGMKSGLYIPMKIQSRAIGCISVESELPYAFTDKDERLITTLAVQAAVAIENARLYESALFAAQRRSVLYQASQELVRITQDQEQIYGAVHRAVSQIMPAEAFTIALLDEMNNMVEAVYLFDQGGRWPSQRMPAGTGFSSRVISSGKTILIKDLETDALEVAHFGTQKHTRSVLAVPMRAGGRVTGAISAQSYAPNAYTADDERLLELLATQAAVALENARLFAQTEARAREFASLHAVAADLASKNDLATLLNTMAVQVASLLNVPGGAVYLYHSETKDLEVVAATHTSMSIGMRLKLGEGMAGRVAESREPMNVDDYHAWSGRAEQYSKFPYGAVLEVPMIYSGDLVGVLVAYHLLPPDPSMPEVRKFNQSDMRLLTLFASHAAGAVYSAGVFRDLQVSNAELKKAYDATIEGWSRALDLRDKETEGHTIRVMETALDLARSMSISEEELEHIRRGALLHDMGKLGVPDSILLKPGKLTDEEWEIMRKHPTFAYDMLAPIPYLEAAAIDIPYCHHEKWDGSGYPRKLKGEEIPLSARIFAVVDVWDALTSDRPYRPGWSRKKALDYIKEQSGQHFDPDVVKAFLKLIAKNKRSKK